MDKNYIKFDKSISIIIPLRNKEATIILTLDELKKRLQKISYEIIIIENGSTDNSYQIAKNWCTENKHIETILTRLTTIGAMYLTIVCLMPEFLIAKYPIPFYLGGTSILIVVVVAMDTVTQVQTRLMSSQYESLIKKAKFGK